MNRSLNLLLVGAFLAPRAFAEQFEDITVTAQTHEQQGRRGRPLSAGPVQRADRYEPGFTRQMHDRPRWCGMTLRYEW